MVRLLAGTEVLLDPVVGQGGPVDQADLVGLVGMVLLVVVLLVGMAVTGDTSNERFQEDSTTGTPSGHDIRFFAMRPPSGICKWWYDSHFPLSLSLLAFSVMGRKYSRANTGCGLLSIRQVYTRVVYFFYCFVLLSLHHDGDF